MVESTRVRRNVTLRATASFRAPDYCSVLLHVTSTFCR